MPAAQHDERIVTVRVPAQTPALTVATPFHGDDPRPLVRALGASASARRIEIVLVNDGGGTAAQCARLLEALEAAGLAATLIVWGANRGRSAARNRLIAAARARHVLFLDADMVPAAPDFIDRWLDLIDAEDPGVAFGGFEVARRTAAETRVHRALAHAADCQSAEDRARDPAQFTATSNLLVRRDILMAVPFDDGFKGWGWEDVDWALRAAERTPIRQVDIPAVHTGLDSVDTLIRKFGEAGANYARLAQKHPHAVRRFRSYRAARALKHAPASVRPALAWLARDPLGVTPVRARCAALRLYRAAVYAAHLP